jgi:hypothetical protein
MVVRKFKQKKPVKTGTILMVNLVYKQNNKTIMILDEVCKK